MKRYLLLFCCLLFARNLSAQVRVDKLVKNIAEAKSDDARMAAYAGIIDYYNSVNPDSAYEYTELALQFAVEKNRLLDKGKMTAQLGIIDRNEGRADLGTQRMKDALAIYRAVNYKVGVAEMLHDLGSVEASTGNFDAAVKYLYAAARLCDSLKNNEGLLNNYAELGKIYMMQVDSADAVKYFTLAAELSRKMPMSNEIISLYNTMGVFAIAAYKDTAKGLQTFLADLELSKKPQFVQAHVECLMYLGNFYLDKGEANKAIHYLEDGLKIAREQKMLEEEANLLVMIAVLIKEKDPSGAMAYLNQAAAICNSMGNKPFLVTVYEEIAALYKDQGNYSAALDETIKKQKLKDSLYHISKVKEIASMNAAYEFEKSTARISELEDESAERKFERNVIIGVAIGVVILLVVLLFFYRKIILLNRELRLHEKELKAANGMKNMLFSIIGHDLRGPIARIPAMLDIFEDDGTTDEERKYMSASLKEHTKATTETLDKLLYWGQSLVKGIMIKQSKVLTSPIIAACINFKKLAAAEKDITIIDKTPPDTTIFADATHFDFVVRNLLANAVKYTHRNGTIEISCEDVGKPDYVVFAIKDNGVGIEATLLSQIFNPLNSTYGTANEKGTGLGLMLCKEFVQQNGGSIWVESEQGKGSIFYFSMQKAK